MGGEVLLVCCIDRLCIWQFDSQGVAKHSVYTKLIVQVRASCATRTAHVADDLPLHDAFAHVHATVEPGHMSV